MSNLSDTYRRAKARLEDMSINEVSLVDAAANLRKLVITKSENGMNKPAQKMSLKLPSAAKQAMMDGIGAALDKLTAIATMVGDAETDDAAAVPADLATALKQVGETISGMGTQYAGAAPPPAEGEKPAGAEGQPPPPDAAGKSATDATEKKLPPELNDGDSLKTLLHDGDSLKTLMLKTVGAAHIELAAFHRLDKAGRKIAGHRYKALEDLRGSLDKLLNELAFDEASGAGEGATDKAKTAEKDKDAKAAEKAKPAEKDEKEPAKKSAEGAASADLSAEAVALMKGIKESLDAQGARLGALEGKVSAVAKATPVSNGGSVEGEKPPSQNDVQWAPDMSAEVAKKRQANGARK